MFHLPIRGGGDGGIYTTAADISTFWRALFAGRIVSLAWVAEMVKPHSAIPEDRLRGTSTRDEVSARPSRVDAGNPSDAAHDICHGFLVCRGTA